MSIDADISRVVSHCSEEEVSREEREKRARWHEAKREPVEPYQADTNGCREGFRSELIRADNRM